MDRRRFLLTALPCLASGPRMSFASAISRPRENPGKTLNLHAEAPADLRRSGLSDDTIIEAGLYTPAPGDLPRLLAPRLVNRVTHILVIPYHGADPSTAPSSSHRCPMARGTRSGTTSQPGRPRAFICRRRL